MPKPIGSPRSLTLTRRREVFRIEIEVGGTLASPTYHVAGHAIEAQRDDSDAVVGQVAAASVHIADAALPNPVRNAIATILNHLDDQP